MAVMPLSPPRRDRPTEAVLEPELMSLAEVTPTGLEKKREPNHQAKAPTRHSTTMSYYLMMMLFGTVTTSALKALMAPTGEITIQVHEDRKTLFGMILVNTTYEVVLLFSVSILMEQEALEPLVYTKGRCHHDLDSLKGLTARDYHISLECLMGRITVVYILDFRVLLFGKFLWAGQDHVCR